MGVKLLDRLPSIKVAFILLLSVVILYAGALDAGFVSDDFVLINRTANEGFYASWGGEANSTFFRPLTTLTYLLDFSLWGNNPVAYHATNLFWHFFVGLIVFYLLYFMAQELSLKKPHLFSLLSAILFLSLASHSESVTWVSGRTDVIATSFSIGSLFLFFRQLRKPSKLFSLLALFSFSIGLFAKESIIITPLLWCALLLYKLPEDKKTLIRNLKLVGFSLIIAILYLTFRFFFNNSLTSGMQYGGYFNLSLVDVLENLTRYLFRVYVPPLSYDLRETILANPIIIPVSILAFFLPLSVLVYKKASRKQIRFLVLMAGLFLLSLIPVLGMKVSLFDSQSERFLYLPSIFASGFFTVLTISLLKEGKLAIMVLICFIVFQGIFLHKSNRNWVEAGRLCSEISEIISEYDSDSIYIEAIPDSFNGAYVFRNGLNEAVELLTGNESDYVVIYYTNSYGDSLSSSAELPVILKNDVRLTINCYEGTLMVMKNCQ